MTDDLPSPEEPPFGVIPQPEFKKGRRFSQAEIDRIIKGEALLPNAKPVDDQEALRYIFHHGGKPEHARVRLDPMHRHLTEQASVYLDGQEFIGYGGGGLALMSGYVDGAYRVKAMTFAICEHKIVSTSTREEDQRGWHKQHCEKCGMDFTYDSGD